MKNIVIRKLNKAFGDNVVLNGFSAVLAGGRTTALMGPSGCGKTTLASILLGLLAADSGTVEQMPARKAAVFQEDRLCEEFSAVANVRLVTGKTVGRAQIETCLRELGLGESLHQPVSTLSGGMRRRVAIARSLLADADFLLLDEPFKGLDEDTRSEVISVVRRHTAGKTVLLITHDPKEAEAFGAEIIRF
ncbi:MAG: ATP-binding cassette domain-containing protein [Clostridia bacterium]|nr:ATP-binding cassette domain-containing protein [Clostridia bacterium]